MIYYENEGKNYSNMSKFEKKFGKYAIKNLSLYLIICYIIGYVIMLLKPDFLSMLSLDPYKIIMEFQIWRLFTWVIIPPGGLSIWVIISLYFYWSLGTSLERTWGTYRYNVYLFTGFLCTILGSFLWLLVGTLQFYPAFQVIGKTLIETMELVGAWASDNFSTFYVNMSILLLFAFTFPDIQILLMFIIPIKVKWIGIAYSVYLGALTVLYLFAGDIPHIILIVMSLLNFIIFFIRHKRRVKMSPKQMKRRVVYRTQTRRANASSRHKCAICGRTEADGDELEFRYCSKCVGNYEYCQDHLFTHTHVQ